MYQSRSLESLQIKDFKHKSLRKVRDSVQGAVRAQMQYSNSRRKEASFKLAFQRFVNFGIVLLLRLPDY
jgi:hypothetical protein